MSLRTAPWMALLACSFVLGARLPLSLAQSAGREATGWKRSARVSQATASSNIPPAQDANSGASIPPASPPASSRATTPVTEPPATRGAATSIRHARVSKGSGTLPNEHGQVWRNYDIRPYTRRVTTTNRPEQAIVDWVLRETGYEAWHGEACAVLNAKQDTLQVFHTPEMQAVVAEIVDRFVNSEAETQAFGIRILTISSPNWRASALRYMTPIPVQSAGVQGWLVAKENAALLVNELRRRPDFREHNSPNLLVHNGQSTVISSLRQRGYTKGITRTAHVWPGFQPEMGVLDEGYSLEFSPLVSLDGTSVDAVIKLRLHQIEKMVPVKLDVPTQVAPNQQTQIQVPQLTMCHLHERFRWPIEQVLVLSMGVVGTPAPQRPSGLAAVLPMMKEPPRADAILLIDSKGRVAPVARNPGDRSAARVQQTSYGRY